MSEYTPIFSTKATGHVTATFKESGYSRRTLRTMWTGSKRSKGWKGLFASQLCSGNGGDLSSHQFLQNLRRRCAEDA